MPSDLPSFLLLLGRLLIGGAFLHAAYGNVRSFDKIIGFLAGRGLPQPRLLLIAATILHTVSSVLVIFGLWTALGAAGLTVFVVAASVVYHNFWAFEGQDRNAKFQSFRTNLIIIGGLLALLAAAL